MSLKFSIEPGQVLVGSLLNQAMRVETFQPEGADTVVLGLVGGYGSMRRTSERSATVKVGGLDGLRELRLRG